MNYRHAFHAGNFADVLKHAVLIHCLEHLKRKEAPFRVIDTHAGIGWYDTSSEEALRSPEWRGGAARIAARGGEAACAAWPALALYRDLLAQGGAGAAGGEGEGDGPRRVPGSPAIAAALMRPADRLTACELHPHDARRLQDAFKADRRVSVQQVDGYAALKALLPPPERRGLVLIDPPFETAHEFECMQEALAEALRRWPTGTYAIWRPLKHLAQAELFDTAAARLAAALGRPAAEALLRIDQWVEALGPGMEGGRRAGSLAAYGSPAGPLAGAGLVIVNPPFTLAPALEGAMKLLTETLARGAGAGWRLDAGPGAGQP